MDAGIVPKAQFANLASGRRPNLRVRESFTMRRRKVIAMYTAKVRIAPIQGDGRRSSWRCKSRQRQATNSQLVPKIGELSPHDTHLHPRRLMSIHVWKWLH